MGDARSPDRKLLSVQLAGILNGVVVSEVFEPPGPFLTVESFTRLVLGFIAQSPTAHPMQARPGQSCTSRGCAACPPAWLTARSAPVSGPPRHLRSSPHPPHGFSPAYTLRRLAASNAPEGWAAMVRDVVELDQSSATRMYGDALPPGLTLLR